MSRHVLTHEDMVDFAEENPWAFTARQGTYERVYGWAIVSLLIFPIFFFLSLINAGHTSWALIASLVFGTLTAISVAVLLLSIKRLSYYDEIDSKRIQRVSEKMKQLMDKKHDSKEFKNFAKMRLSSTSS